MSAKVKSLLSADTLVLVDKQTNREFQLSLAYVAAPRMTEPWGFDAREYLRKMALAKPVSYKIWYDVNGREYGDVASPIFKSLIEHMLEKGWVKLRDDSVSKAGYASYGDRLVDAEAKAKNVSAGIWTDKKWNSLNVRGSVPQDLYGSKRQIPAIVERVISGDRIMLRSMMDPDDHYLGPAILGGIRTHRTTSANNTTAAGGPGSVGDAFGDAAAEALSTRLLQRSQVRAVFLAPSKANPDIPLVTLQHPQGDIALVLVSSGLAEVPNTPEIGAERLLQLRNAQREAQSKGLGLFRAQAQALKQHKDAYGNQASEGTVVKVISADMVVLEPGNRTVQLSSTRAPRRNEDPKHSVDAREFARKLLIGQTVRVQVDGENSVPNSDEPPRQVVTLSYGSQFAKNAALEIISAGWATAFKHRRDDLARSPFYDELVAAEEAAEKAKRGIFAPPPPKSKGQAGAVVDASESAIRARSYLGALQRRNRIPAVIDNVISAGRLRLNVPSENCTLVVVLDGVQLPKASEPYADEAFAYTFREWNQRDVQISVRSVDKTGAFVATVLKNTKSLAIELLSRGLARVHEGSANASGLRDEYDEAQERAQDEQKGLWTGYSKEAEQVSQLDLTDKSSEIGSESTAASASTAATATGYVDAVISHVALDSIFVRLAGNNSKYLQIKSELQKFFTAASNTNARAFDHKIRRREMVVLADSYNRAVVTAIIPGGQYSVDVIDTGDQQTVSASELLPIPSQYAAIPALARSLVLRYVHRPIKMYEKDFLKFLSKFVSQQVVVNGDIVYTADTTGPNDSLNTRIIASGWAAVPFAQAKEEGAAYALELQEQVKSEGVGMWEYGDPREEDDL